MPIDESVPESPSSPGLRRDLENARVLLESEASGECPLKYTKTAEAILRRVLKDDPDNVDAKALLARAEALLAGVAPSPAPDVIHMAASVAPPAPIPQDFSFITQSVRMKPVQKRTRRPLRGLIGVVATIVVSGLLMFGFPSNPLKVQYPPKVTTPAPAKSGVAAASFKQKSIPVLPMADPFATAPSLPAIALAPATTVIPAPVSPVLQVKTKLPAVAAIQTGTLAVSSPTTVDIYMGDQFVGSAPATLELQAGSQTIEYRHKGMKKVVTHFIRPNEMTTAMVTFDVPVQINAKPWAQVFIDGSTRQPLGQTPLSEVLVPIGGVLIFENPNFPGKTYRVKGTETEIRVTFP